MFAKKIFDAIREWANKKTLPAPPNPATSQTGKEKTAKTHILSRAETEKFLQKRWEELRKIHSLSILQENFRHWPEELICERAREIVAMHSWRFAREELECFMNSWIVPPDAQKILQRRYQKFICALPQKIFTTVEGLHDLFKSHTGTKCSLIIPRLFKVLSPLIPKMSQKELDAVWAEIPFECQQTLYPLKEKREEKLFEEKIIYETSLKELEHWYKHYRNLRPLIESRYKRLAEAASPETARWRASKKDCPEGLRKIALAAYLKKLRKTHDDYPLEWLCDEAWKCPNAARKEIVTVLKARIQKTSDTKQIGHLLYKFFNCDEQEIADLLRAKYAEIINPLIPRMPANEIVKHYFLKNLLPGWFGENLLERFRVIIGALKTPEDLETIGAGYCCDLAEIAINKYKQFLESLKTAKEMEERYQKAPKDLQTVILRLL